MPSRQELGEDTIGWKWKSDRRFSVKSAYDQRRSKLNTNVEREDIIWSTVAKFRGIPIFKSFLWLMAHERILTNKERARRHLTSQTKCEACGAAEESIHHIFRECPIAYTIWQSLIRQEKMTELMETEIKQWIYINIDKPEQFIRDAEDWDLLFGSIIWSIWLHRNNNIFGSLMEDNVATLKQMDKTRHGKYGLQAWNPPPTDGSS
ncbi:hypothetical protein F3Y22_tig00110059pilonHSYRG00042 [Hibiscus syriacus]|uniref:Reverse transcriptase zinc-binding domain-containing protein n=1 Tax=Hibiscus syriacus TaxID=106335 RepID=A0A6A3BJB0_HIBSY|nr:hypothetical protein F3Y22_tig00110059pilonHSYRG00042 [Hibiscus syriacus]